MSSAHEQRALRHAERPDVVVADARGGRLAFDKDGMGGAPGQCFQAERAGPRKDVNNARTFDDVAAPPFRVMQNIEDGLARAVAGRPRGAAFRASDGSSLQVSADDAHAAVASIRRL
jgi:hypothetical protein